MEMLLSTAKNIEVDKEIRHLYHHLAENEYVIDIPDYREDVLPYYSHIVLQKIKNKDPEWEHMVPKYVSAFIKSKKLFGYSGNGGRATKA